MIHDDRIDGAEEDPNEGHGDRTTNKVGDQPDDKLQPAKMKSPVSVQMDRDAERENNHPMARIA